MQELTPLKEISYVTKTQKQNLGKLNITDWFYNYEQTELLNYDEIYYFSDLHTKMERLEDYTLKTFRYNPIVDDHIHYRFQIISKLGKGSFGDVLLCKDHKRHYDVALKIIKSEDRYYESYLNEIEFLKILMNDNEYIVSALKYFKFRNHPCIVFEKLDINLFTFLKDRQFKPLELNMTRNIMRQVLLGLSVLKKHNIIHGDLKPENVLFTDDTYTKIKIVDFGSSIFHKIGKYQTYIQTRWYRSPEVILGYPIDFNIDIWSVGCMLYELHTGKVLFNGKNIDQQISKFYSYIDRVPEKEFIVCCRKNSYFSFVGENIHYHNFKGRLCNNYMCHDEVTNILKNIIVWEPYNRLNVDNLLKLQWFNEF